MTRKIIGNILMIFVFFKRSKIFLTKKIYLERKLVCFLDFKWRDILYIA
jgi:hypothetical protein